MSVRPVRTGFAGCTSPRSSEATRAFYEENASEYAKATLDSPMAAALSGFVALLRPGDGIVDLGCGAGRDLRSFRHYGLKPIGLDYSIALCSVARRVSGVPIVAGDMRQLPFERDAFRGASAVASLLHLRRNEMRRALTEIGRVLRPEGLLFTSMKRGSGEDQDRHGRWFSYFEPEEWADQLRVCGFEPLEMKSDVEQRGNSFSTEDISWVSCLCKKS